MRTRLVMLFICIFFVVTLGCNQHDESRGKPFETDFSEIGWNLVWHNPSTPPSQNKWNICIYNFVWDWEDQVSGEELLCRANEISEGEECGQLCAEWLYYNQETIPKGWQGYVMLFLGTVWENIELTPCILAMVWNGDQWLLLPIVLEGPYESFHRIVRIE